MPRRKQPPKHRYGSGSVFQRSDGRWAFVGSINGVRQRPAYFETEAAARAYRAEFATSGRRDYANETLGQYLNRWLPNHADSAKLAPNTVRSYGHALLHARTEGVSDTLLRELRPADLERYVQYLVSVRKLAPKSVRLYRGVLVSALQDAVRLQILPSNPAAPTRAPRLLPAPPKVVWDERQLEQFYAANADDRLLVLWRLLLTLGCRDSEARALTWDDLNTGAGTLTIARGLSQRGDHEGDTKTHRVRSVPLPPSLVAALRAHRLRQNEELLSHGGSGRINKRIFCNPDGRRLTYTQTAYQFALAVKRAKLPPLLLHGTRHTAATRLLTDGVPHATVALILGHADPSITMKTYAHVTRPDLRAAVASMERSLGGVKQAQNPAHGTD